MLLFYSEQVDEAAQARREAQDLPLMLAAADSLREAGILLGSDRLQPADTATTVRVRDGRTELVDGPFAETKELLGGYFLLECADLDEALRHAASVPVARFGSVEVRPVMEIYPSSVGQGGAAEP
jgi:hypothetical protein